MTGGEMMGNRQNLRYYKNDRDYDRGFCRGEYGKFELEGTVYPLLLSGVRGKKRIKKQEIQRIYSQPMMPQPSKRPDSPHQAWAMYCVPKLSFSLPLHFSYLCI